MPESASASEKRGKNRPVDSPYTQQKLPSWQPLYTPRTVVSTLALLGLFLVFLSGFLVVANNKVKEIKIPYTDCQEVGVQESTCAQKLRAGSREACRCNVDFTVPMNLDGPVYLHYGLENFYQNYRRYVSSKSPRQLHGDGGADNCGPLSHREGKDIAPCGFIANSMFNDTVELVRLNGQNIELSANDIAWSVDRKHKYKNPPSWDNTVPPPYWTHNVTSFVGNAGQGYLNQDLMVWMRTAALPDFRKLYRIIPNGLTRGTYSLRINYNFPVDTFEGKKYFVLSTSSMLGGKNRFLGVMYMVTGTVSLVVAMAITIRMLAQPRRLGDPRYLQWRLD